MHLQHHPWYISWCENLNQYQILLVENFYSHRVLISNWSAMKKNKDSHFPRINCVPSYDPCFAIWPAFVFIPAGIWAAATCLVGRRCTQCKVAHPETKYVALVIVAFVDPKPSLPSILLKLLALRLPHHMIALHDLYGIYNIYGSDCPEQGKWENIP